MRQVLEMRSMVGGMIAAHKNEPDGKVDVV